MGWLRFFRPHKHSFKFQKRNLIGMYVFECECGEICTIHPYTYWNRTQTSSVRIWMWNNS